MDIKSYYSINQYHPTQKIIEISENMRNQLLHIGETSPPACQCGCCEESEQVFECSGCKRIMFWCYGQADHYSPYCDFCVAVIEKGN